MKKRFLSIFLALALCATLLPATALAEEFALAAEDMSLCTCEAACAADAMNAACSICGTEGAAETDCVKYVEPAREEAAEEPTGEPEEPAEAPAEPTAIERVQALLDALPTAEDVADMDEETRDAAYLAAQEAYDALEELTAEELEQITGVAALEALLTAFTEEPETYSNDDWVLYLGGVNVRDNPNGNGYSYDEENHILTLNGYSTDKTSPEFGAHQPAGYYNYDTAFLYCSRSYKGTGPLNKKGNLIIVLNGINTLGTKTAESYSYLPVKSDLDKPRVTGIFCDQDGVTVRGTGSLSVQCQVYAYAGASYTQESGTVTMRSAMKCIELFGNMAVESGELTVETLKNDLPFPAVQINTGEISGSKYNDTTQHNGMLYIASGAKMTATTNGSYYNYEGNTTKFPCAIQTAGMIFVYGELNANNEGKAGSNQTDGNQGIALYTTSTLVVDKGGTVYASNKGKNSKDAYDGEAAIKVGSLQVGEDGFLYAYNYNTSKAGLIVTGTLKMNNSSYHSAVFTYPYDAVQHTDGAIWSATELALAEYNHPKYVVVISGLRRTTLYLKTQTYVGETCWVYRDDASLWGGKKNTLASAYDSTGGLNLTGTTTAKYGYNSILPLDYTAIKNIVVEEGHQVLKLDNAIIKDRTETEPYITVKSGATLTLLLSGANYLERTSWNMSVDSLIRVEEGGTLNIKLADGADPNSFLSIVTTGSAINAKYVDGNGKATINLQSGTIYTGNYSSIEGYVAGYNTIGDTLCNINISGGYVAADLKGNLKITGGTIPEGCTYYGTDITVDGGSVGLDFYNKDVVVKNSSGAAVSKTTVQLYNAKKLKTEGVGTWKQIQYYTKYDSSEGGFVKQTITLPKVLRLDLTENNATYSGYGITDLYGTTDDDPYLYLYLPADVQAEYAALNEIPQITGYESQVFRANKGEEVKSGTSGKLYLRTLVIGKNVIALRGNPDTSKYYNEVQMSPHYTGADSDIWYDYDKTEEMTIGAADDNDTKVTEFGVSVLSSTHSITFKRLNVIGGENQRLELKSSYDRPSVLNLLLDGNCSLTANGSDPVVKLGGTLNIAGSYEKDGSTISTNGRLTLKGSGKAFATSYGYDAQEVLKILDNALSAKDAMLINECTDSGGTYFTSLKFDNATVIGLGKVKSYLGITINGGSVDIEVEQGTVKNSNGNVLTKTPFQVTGVSDYTKIDTLTITGLPTGVTFDDDCVWTDKQGNITLWLPEDAALESAKIGSETYYPVPDGQGGTKLMTAQAPAFDTTADTVVSLPSGAFTLTATATGSPVPTYQWQKWNGTEWENISDATGTSYSGTMTATMHGEQYRCSVSNSNGTATKTFTLFYLPAITTQPAAQTAAAGADAAFSVALETVEGITLGYQWQYSTDGTNWTDISGATESSYTASAVTAAMDGRQYRCQLTCTSGMMSGEMRYSDAATLTVVGAPSFTTQPESRTIKTGESAVFTVAAIGNYTLNYQWQYSTDSTDWTDISGATGTTYTLSDATDAMNGRKFRCAATNAANGVTNTTYSDAATLAVVGAPVITKQPVSTAVYENRQTTFSITASGNQTIGYQWQVKKTDENGEPTGDFADIAGATSAEYQTEKTTLQMDGWQYRCVVKNASGVVVQEITSDEAKLVVARPGSQTKSDISITSGNDEHGNIDLPKSYGYAGETVTIQPQPDDGYRLETLTVTDKNGNEIELTDLGNGKFSFIMPAGEVTIQATYVKEDGVSGFADVPAGSYYCDAVLWAAKNGITGGIDENHFGPDLSCTRAQLVTFLWRAAGCPVVNNAMDFTDVAEDAYYTEAVRWAASHGVVTGYGNGLFGPNDEVLREQVVAILYRYAVAMSYDVSVGEDTNILSYNDAFEVSEYAISAFQWATGTGIVQGADGNLMPKASCTRAQIVTMLYRLLGE